MQTAVVMPGGASKFVISILRFGAGYPRGRLAYIILNKFGNSILFALGTNKTERRRPEDVVDAFHGRN